MRLLLIHQKHVTDLLTAISERSHEKKTLLGGRKRPHRFFIKRKPHRLTRVEKTPEPWPMPERAKPRSEHSEGFFYPNSRKFASDENQTQDLLRRDATGWASQLGRPTFRSFCISALQVLTYGGAAELCLLFSPEYYGNWLTF